MFFLSIPQVTTVVNDPGSEVEPYDIAIDPYARTLYWTCTHTNVINVTRIDVARSPIGVILSASGFKPRSIVLYPEKGSVVVLFALIVDRMCNTVFGIWVHSERCYIVVFHLGDGVVA